LVDPFLCGPYIRRPGALDESEHRPDLIVTKDTAKGWHVVLIVGWGTRLPTVLNNVKQERIGMMPGVAGRVMGRRRPTTRGQFLLPIWLAFKVGAVTSRAVCSVNVLPLRDLSGIARVGTIRRASARQIQEDQADRHDGNKPDDEAAHAM